MLKYSARVQFFFQKLVRRVRVAENRALYRVAGLIRTTARRTLRIKDGSSQAGSPPHAHSREGLRTMEFAVFGNSAVIGPVKFPSSNMFNDTVPHIHEFGGTYTTRRYMYNFPQRPYMSVALSKLIAKGLIPREFSATMATIIEV